MHRREFLCKALGFAVVAGAVAAVASPAEALPALIDPHDPSNKDDDGLREDNRADVSAEENRPVEFGGKRGGRRGGGRGRGRGRGWGFGRRGWGRRRRVRRGWYRRRWGRYRRRRWWGRRRRWWRRRSRRRNYYF